MCHSAVNWFFLILCGYRNLYDAITLRKHSRIPRNGAWKKMPGENPRLNQIPLALSMRYIRLEVSIATENEADPIRWLFSTEVPNSHAKRLCFTLGAA